MSGNVWKSCPNSCGRNESAHGKKKAKFTKLKELDRNDTLAVAGDY